MERSYSFILPFLWFNFATLVLVSAHDEESIIRLHEENDWREIFRPWLTEDESIGKTYGMMRGTGSVETPNHVYLRCVVENYEGAVLHWTRQVDNRTMTIGLILGVRDKSYRVTHKRSVNSWSVDIRSTCSKDAEHYHCFARTNTSLRFIHNLTLIGEKKDEMQCGVEREKNVIENPYWFITRIPSGQRIEKIVEIRRPFPTESKDSTSLWTYGILQNIVTVKNGSTADLKCVLKSKSLDKNRGASLPGSENTKGFPVTQKYNSINGTLWIRSTCAEHAGVSECFATRDHFLNLNEKPFIISEDNDEVECDIEWDKNGHAPFHVHWLCQWLTIITILMLKRSN